MKQVLSILFFIFSVTSCSNTLSYKQLPIKPEFTHNGINLVYSELITNDIEAINNKVLSNSTNTRFKIKILRTSSLNNKQVRQSSHYLNADLKARLKYRVNTSIKDDVLNVWLTNSANLEVVSSVSTLNTVFEKVFTLEDETKDEAYRIKVILNNLYDKIAHVRIINKRKPRYSWD
jgi:hypothetical protein